MKVHYFHLLILDKDKIKVLNEKQNLKMINLVRNLREVLHGRERERGNYKVNDSIVSNGQRSKSRPSINTQDHRFPVIEDNTNLSVKKHNLTTHPLYYTKP